MNEASKRWAIEQKINPSTIALIINEMSLSKYEDQTSIVDLALNTYPWEKLLAGFERLVSYTDDETSSFVIKTQTIEGSNFPHTTQSVAICAKDWTIKIAERLVLDRSYKFNIKNADVRMIGKMSFFYSLPYNLGEYSEFTDPKILTINQFEINGKPLSLYVVDDRELHIGGLYCGNSYESIAEARMLISK